MEKMLVLRGICLALGMLAGCLVPGWAARAALPGWKGLAMAAGESAAVLLACLACGVGFALQPQQAMLYAGLGVVAGCLFPLTGAAQPHRGLTAVCVWLSLCLPFTGALCCLAGWALGRLLGRPLLGLAMVPLFAVPMAYIQFGTESAAPAALAALLCIGCRLPPVRRRLYHLGRIR